MKIYLNRHFCVLDVKKSDIVGKNVKKPIGKHIKKIADKKKNPIKNKNNLVNFHFIKIKAIPNNLKIKILKKIRKMIKKIMILIKKKKNKKKRMKLYNLIPIWDHKSGNFQDKN